MQNVFDKDLSRWVMKTAHMWAKARIAKARITHPNMKIAYCDVFKACLKQAHIKAARILDDNRQIRELVVTALQDELFESDAYGIAPQLRAVFDAVCEFNCFNEFGMALTRTTAAFYQTVRKLMDNLDLRTAMIKTVPYTVETVRYELNHFAD